MPPKLERTAGTDTSRLYAFGLWGFGALGLFGLKAWGSTKPLPGCCVSPQGEPFAGLVFIEKSAKIFVPNFKPGSGVSISAGM